MSQQALWSHDDQWLAPRAHDLPAEEVEVLAGRRRDGDLDIVLCRLLEEALQACAGVLRALALEAVR